MSMVSIVQKGMKFTMAKKDEENKLLLIPKSEKYAEYIIDLIIKLPRTEKFSIGNEYKTSLYKMLEKIMYINKMSKEEILELFE